MVVEFLESGLTQTQNGGAKQNTGNGHIRSEKIPKFCLVGKEWEYRGEGNGSIVLSLPKDKIIIRITKVGDNEQMSFRDSIEVKNMIPNPGYPIGSLKETMERLVFSENVIGKLLEGSLVKKGTIYQMEPSEIQKLSAILDPVRPGNRLHKRLNPRGLVTGYPDCTLLQGASSVSLYPTYCVEIKPKQGFKSSPNHKRCPFCLNQFLKAKNGKIARRSSYCPMDLFSGSYQRMFRAAMELIRTPQNNLRIFKDGNLALSEESSVEAIPVLNEWLGKQEKVDNGHSHSADEIYPRSFSSFAHLLIQALLSPLSKKSQPISFAEDYCGNSKNGFASSPRFTDISNGSLGQTRTGSIFDPCDTHMDILPEGSVLDRLLKTQKLGEVPALSLYKAYDKLAEDIERDKVPLDRLRWSSGAYENIDWLFNDEDEDDFEAALKIIQRYRILATARDCSIMIIFDRVHSSSGIDDLVVQDLEDRLYRCQISVVDLDPKPITCVLKHRRRERSMTEAYSQAVENGEESPESSSCIF